MESLKYYSAIIVCIIRSDGQIRMDAMTSSEEKLVVSTEPFLIVDIDISISIEVVYRYATGET